MKRTLAILALSLCATFGFAQANYMNYQGKLVTETGAALPPGQHIMEVNLYDAASGGTRIWGPFTFDGGTGNGHAEFVSVMNDGRFNVIMGPKDTAGRDISAAFQHNVSQNRFIELKVNGGSPILPRQQFLSAPYAFQASRLPDVSNTSTGNVGVGTNSPSEKLDVSGNVKVSGTLNVGGKATLASAQVNGSLAVGTRTLSTTSNVLNVDGSFKVNGNIEFTGSIVNFGTTSYANAISEPDSGNNPKDNGYDTGISASNYFCALRGMSWYSATNAGRPDNGAWLDVGGNGNWVLTVRADGNGYTWASVNCFKYK